MALSDITQARFVDSRFLPKLELSTQRGTISFRTPHDSYGDEMDFDRKNLVQAARFVEHLRVSGDVFQRGDAPHIEQQAPDDHR